MRFAALRTPWYKGYLLGGSLAMTADHIEHAISYFVMWQLFESPALAGFAVVSHWLPHLLFNIPIGWLADRVDCRRLVQAGQLLFMLASAGWAALFFMGTVEVWHCIVLLSLHGVASALWATPEQMLLYDIAGPAVLPSAVRLQATGLTFGQLLGPAIGAALMATIGPAWGMLANIAVYLPFMVYLSLLPLTGHTRYQRAPQDRVGLRDIFSVIPELPKHPAILAVTVMMGAVGLLIGTTFLPLLPEFGRVLGVGDAGLGYGLLLVAMSAGAVIGGLVTESIARVRPSVRLAVISASVFALALLVFALSESFALSLVMLVIAGFGNLVAVTVSQTIVQLQAPPHRRGSFIGAFNMAGTGFRAVSGVLMAVVGTALGVTTALALNAGVLLAIGVVLLVVVLVAARRAARRAALRAALNPAPGAATASRSAQP